VKWFSHGGPDAVENGLSSCSLHHKAFDLGAIAISDDHKVLVSRDFRGGGEWEARSLRVSGASPVGPQAGEPPVRVSLRGTARRSPRAASSGRVRRGGVRALVTGHRRSASLCDRMRCHACNEGIGRITVASFGVTPPRDTRVAIHPSTSVSSQPTVFVVSRPRQIRRSLAHGPR
jgi:hypothetical protein